MSQRIKEFSADLECEVGFCYTLHYMHHWWLCVFYHSHDTLFSILAGCASVDAKTSCCLGVSVCVSLAGIIAESHYDSGRNMVLMHA